jgi:hypothetical protein
MHDHRGVQSAFAAGERTFGAASGTLRNRVLCDQRNNREKEYDAIQGHMLPHRHERFGGRDADDESTVHARTLIRQRPIRTVHSIHIQDMLG